MDAANPFFPPMVIGGETKHFQHLDPFQLLVPSMKARRDLIVDVRFTNHCFSYRHEHAEVHEGVLFDHNGFRRIFCDTRYQLSRSLPGILQELNQPSAKVWQTTARRNWTYIVQVERPGLYDGRYYVFFELRRAPSTGGRGDDLKLTVESAYHESEGYEAPRKLGKMGFRLLCGKIYLGEPVATRR